MYLCICCLAELLRLAHSFLCHLLHLLHCTLCCIHHMLCDWRRHMQLVMMRQTLMAIVWGWLEEIFSSVVDLCICCLAEVIHLAHNIPGRLLHLLRCTLCCIHNTLCNWRHMQPFIC